MNSSIRAEMGWGVGGGGREPVKLFATVKSALTNEEMVIP